MKESTKAANQAKQVSKVNSSGSLEETTESPSMCSIVLIGIVCSKNEDSVFRFKMRTKEL